MTAKHNKTKSNKPRDSRRPQSAPRPSGPEAADAAAAPPQAHSDTTPMEEHSEIVRRQARTTRPGTGDDEPPATARGLGLTVTDKSLRPSVLRWKSWQVSDSFRDYAERAARGEKLPRFEGSILADPSRMLPIAPPTESQRLRAYRRLKAARPTWMNPNSWVWNPWLWASSALAFAVALFSLTLWYTSPRDEVTWEANALTPLRTPAPRPSATPVPTPPEPLVEAPARAEALAPSATAAPTPTPAAPPSTPAKLAAVAPPAPKPPIAPAPPLAATAPVEVAASAPPAMAKTAPVDRTAAELDAFLKGLEVQPNAKRAGPVTAATNPPPVPVAASAPVASAPAAPAANSADPLLLEAPSF
jgi:hypothetical protein